MLCNTAGYFTSQFYFFEPLRREKINLTSKNTAVFHNFLCNKLFIIRLGIFECKFVKRTLFNRSSFLWNCRAENLKS